MEKFKYLLFDLDGTLTDSMPGIKNSFKYAFKEMNEKIPDDSILSTFIGPPLFDTFTNLCGFNKEKADIAIKKYREYYQQKGIYENSVYDGIPELLEGLKKYGKKLYVATSKPEIFSIKILEHFNLDKYFEKICGSNADESRGNKDEVIRYAIKCIENKTGSHLELNTILMIGDRKHDIIGAKKNNIQSCGILFGYGNYSELKEHGADYIAEDIEKLKEICVL